MFTTHETDELDEDPTPPPAPTTAPDPTIRRAFLPL